MAVVNVSFDTMSKAMKVSVDGVEVADARTAEFYQVDENKYAMCVSSGRKNDNGTYEMHRVCASENGDIVEATDKVPDSVQVTEEIAKFLMGK